MCLVSISFESVNNKNSDFISLISDSLHSYGLESLMIDSQEDSFDKHFKTELLYRIPSKQVSDFVDMVNEIIREFSNTNKLEKFSNIYYRSIKIEFLEKISNVNTPLDYISAQLNYISNRVDAIYETTYIHQQYLNDLIKANNQSHDVVGDIQKVVQRISVISDTQDLSNLKNNMVAIKTTLEGKGYDLSDMVLSETSFH